MTKGTTAIVVGSLYLLALGAYLFFSKPIPDDRYDADVLTELQDGVYSYSMPDSTVFLADIKQEARSRIVGTVTLLWPETQGKVAEITVRTEGVWTIDSCIFLTVFFSDYGENDLSYFVYPYDGFIRVTKTRGRVGTIWPRVDSYQGFVPSPRSMFYEEGSPKGVGGTADVGRGVVGSTVVC